MMRFLGFRKPKTEADWGNELAAILLIGERANGPVVSIGKGTGNAVEWFSTRYFPDSPGCFAHSFVHFLNQASPEGLARLATFANPESATFFHYYELIQEHLIRMETDGDMSLNKKYYRRRRGLVLPNENGWKNLFQLAPPEIGTGFVQEHFDLALAAQRVLEDLVFALAGTAGRLSGVRILRLSGRQVLTPPVVGTLAQTGLFDHIYFGPRRDLPAITAGEIPLIREAAGWLAEGKLVLWGNKYLLADPRRQGVKEKINEWSDLPLTLPMDALALAPEAGKFLEMKGLPPVKRLSLNPVKAHRKSPPARYFGWSWQEKAAFDKSSFPAITHADFSIWATFPDSEEDPLESRLVRAFFDASGCPMLAFGRRDRYPALPAGSTGLVQIEIP